MVLQQAGFLLARRVPARSDIWARRPKAGTFTYCQVSRLSRGRHEEGVQRSGSHCWMGRNVREEFMRGGGEEHRRLPGKESVSTWAGRG